MRRRSRIGRAGPPALLCAALAACAPRASVPAAQKGLGTVTVRLMHDERAVPGAVAAAVSNPGLTFEEVGVLAAAGADGRARLRLPPGIYFLTARAGPDGLFGFYGSNPLQVRPGEELEVVIKAAPDDRPRRSPAARGEEVLSGEVRGEEGPLAGAAVAFYLDAATGFRGPGYLELESDAQGRFETRVSPGRYYLVARRRQGGGSPFGPLEPGDDFGFYAANPVTVGEGERVDVRLGAVRVRKKSGWSAPTALRTRVTGTIRDGAGRPLAGYRAILHRLPSLQGRAEFVSEPSGEDGGYLIWVERSGRYYLAARAEIGRSREEGEVVGFYAGSPDHAVQVSVGGGELRGLDIAVGEPAP